MVFHEIRHLLQPLAQKLTKTPKRGSLHEKLQVLAKSTIFRAFLRNEALLAKKFVETPKHDAFFEKLQVLAKSTIFRVCSRNDALSAFFGWKVRQNAETWCFVRKVASLGQIDDLSCFFAKWDTFCHFLVKSSSKRRKTVVSSKSVPFWANRGFFVFFHEMRHFLLLLAEKFGKTPKHGGFFEKLQVLAKSTIFRAFPRNDALFATFGRKVRQNAETRWFLRKVASFGKIDEFSCFSAKWGTFCYFWLKSSAKRRNTVVSSKSCKFGQIDDFSCFSATWGTFSDFWLKSSAKRRNTVVSSKSCKFWQNRGFFVLFREMRHFLLLLAEKFGKTPKHGGFFEKLQVLAKSTIFRVFTRNEALLATFRWKVRQNPETLWFLRKVEKFDQIDDFRVFLWNEALFATFGWKVRQNA